MIVIPRAHTRGCSATSFASRRTWTRSRSAWASTIRPIVATDADLAGRVAAERDYWILTPWALDPRHAALPEGTDPADLVATGRGTLLVDALTQARPLAQQLIDERFAHLPPADAALDAVPIVAAQPSVRWEAGVQDIANRLAIPPDVIRGALADHVRTWNQDPRCAAQMQLPAIRETKARIVRAEAASAPESVDNPHRSRIELERHLVRTPLRPNPKGCRPLTYA